MLMPRPGSGAAQLSNVDATADDDQRGDAVAVIAGYELDVRDHEPRAMPTVWPSFTVISAGKGP